MTAGEISNDRALSAAERIFVPFRLEGFSGASVRDVLVGQRIIAFACPSGQSLGCTWQLRVFLDSGVVVEFSSLTTDLGNWQEVGSLLLRAVDGRLPTDMCNHALFQSTMIGPFRINRIDCLLYETKDVLAECGVVLHSEEDQEIIIAAGVPPGSVSVSASSIEAQFEPEFETRCYQRMPL